jgi:hypothetical protein
MVIRNIAEILVAFVGTPKARTVPVQRLPMQLFAREDLITS